MRNLGNGHGTGGRLIRTETDVPTQKNERTKMFKRHAVASDGLTRHVTVLIDDEPVKVREGDTVAAAVLLSSKSPYRRTILNGEPRAPFCMMGICFECLVEIEGVANRQGCMIPVRSGMRIVRQMGLRDVKGL